MKQARVHNGTYPELSAVDNHSTLANEHRGFLSGAGSFTANAILVVTVTTISALMIWLTLSIYATASAYVNGESLWSKGELGAIQHLILYADTGDANELDKARLALDVPMGDRDARLALEKQPYDVEAARAGFLRGGNNEADIHGLILLFLYFSDSPLLSEAVGVWRESDPYILDLARSADQLEELYGQPERDTARISAIRAQIVETGRVLSPLSKRFSSSIHIGLRKLQTLLTWTSALVMLLVSVTAAVLRQRNRNRIRNSEMHFRRTFMSAGVGMARLDSSLTFIDVNPSLSRLLQQDRSSLLGQRLTHHIHPEDRAKLDPVKAGEVMQSDRDIPQIELRVLRRDGEQFWARATLTGLRMSGDPKAHALLIIEDLSETERLTSEIAYQASHDELTGLINRREVEAQVRRLAEHARTHNSIHALCFIDLDQFKLINDTSGHAAGDALLCELAHDLPRVLSTRDHFGRLGGDEFAAVLEFCAPERAMQVAEKMREVLEDCSFHWEGRIFRITASFGVVPINAHSGDVSSILRAADSACYVAKEDGRDRIHLYTESDERVTKRRGEMEWVSEIRSALAEDRLVLSAQMIQPAGGDSGLHYEVLLRLIDSQGNEHSPGKFLPAAERYGQAVAVDLRVISRALDFLAKHPAHLQALDLCHINVSAQSMGDPVFGRQVVQLIDQHNIPGHKLCFELTETATIGNLLNAQRFMKAVRARGCLLALDDFGSGLSSFGYLKTLEFDILKIDGVFINNLNHEPVNQAVVRSIVDIGRTLGKPIIAEWVDKPMLRQLLAAMRVDMVQGFHIHKPCPLGELPIPKIMDTAGPAA